MEARLLVPFKTTSKDIKDVTFAEIVKDQVSYKKNFNSIQSEAYSGGIWGLSPSGPVKSIDPLGTNS